MSLTLFHRTSIAAARVIAKHGFADDRWSFVADLPGTEPVRATGVLLTDRAMVGDEGPDGDATLEVTLRLSEGALTEYEVEDVIPEGRLWVVPAEMLNPRASVRITSVDPRTSWFHERLDPEDTGEAD